MRPSAFTRAFHTCLAWCQKPVVGGTPNGGDRPEGEDRRLDNEEGRRAIEEDGRADSGDGARAGGP